MHEPARIRFFSLQSMNPKSENCPAERYLQRPSQKDCRAGGEKPLADDVSENRLRRRWRLDDIWRKH
jgi:hypothetical protein